MPPGLFRELSDRPLSEDARESDWGRSSALPRPQAACVAVGVRPASRTHARCCPESAGTHLSPPVAAFDWFPTFWESWFLLFLKMVLLS